MHLQDLRVRPGRRMAAVFVVLAVAVGMLPAGQTPRALSAPAANLPDDRYVMAGGCFAVRSASTGRYVARTDGGFSAGATSRSAAEPFRFQAAALGRYLLYGTENDFLAAQEGVVGQVADPAKRSYPGSGANGLSQGATDDTAD